MVFYEDKHTKGMNEEEICARYENPEFWQECEDKELAYFQDNIPALIKEIKSAVTEITKEFISWDIPPENEHFALVLYGYTFRFKDAEKLERDILRGLKRQLELLKEKDAEQYNIIIHYISEAVRKAKLEKKRKRENSNFSKVLQGNETNKLTKINSKKNKQATTDPFTGSMKITQEDISFTLLNYAKSTGLRQSVYQLLDILLEVYTNSGGHSEMITIPLKDYMERRGLKDEKSARQQIKEDLNTLENIKMTFTQKLRGGKNGTSYFDVGILQHSKGIVNGVITVYLDTVFHTLLGGYNPMPYPTLLWQLSENRNPHSFYFLRKISEMKFMNAGKLNEDTIAVLTLLEASPNMPKYEEIAETDRHYGRRFIEPFERDMDALDEVLTWEYCHSNNIPLTDEELSAMNYEIFHKLYVKIHWRLYPDQTERLQRKAITAKKYAKKKTIQKK